MNSDNKNAAGITACEIGFSLAAKNAKDAEWRVVFRRGRRWRSSSAASQTRQIGFSDVLGG